MSELKLKTVVTEEDINAVVRLAEIIWHEHYDGLLGVNQVNYMLPAFQSMTAITLSITEGTLYKLMLADGVPAGYYAAKPEKERVFLSKIYLLSQYRGMGFSRRVLEDLALAFPEGKPVYLTVNKGNADSIAVYQKLGFHTIDAVKTDIGNGFFMDDYIMQKD